MAKYIKRPVVVEAYKLFENDVPAWFHRAKEAGVVIVKDDEVIVRTLEGDMTGHRGDYIIQGVRGELYPCQKDIFVQTYQEVDE